MITFFGIAETSGQVQISPGNDGFGRPVYPRPQSRNFIIVVEAKRGPNNFDIGRDVFVSDPSDPSARPDLQIQSNRPLGDGSQTICDKGDPILGGVPAVTPTSYDPSSQFIANALNDLGCRFVVHSLFDDACTFDQTGGSFRFVSLETRVQFCFEPAVGSEVGFPSGDTVLTVRVRNVFGGLGDPSPIVVRVP